MDSRGDLEETLQQWYGRQSARRVDLVGDYAGKELFLLEGDSLLLHCFSDATLDFKRKSNQQQQDSQSSYVQDRWLTSSASSGFPASTCRIPDRTIPTRTRSETL